MKKAELLSRVRAAALDSTLFRVAYLALYVVTALVSAATALALFWKAGQGWFQGFLAVMLLFHGLAILLTQLVLRVQVLRLADLPRPRDKYPFYAWVVARNALVHVGVYLFFAFLTLPVFKPVASEPDFPGATAYLLLALMSAGFLAVKGKETLDAAHHS